jgi:hypothetical protein
LRELLSGGGTIEKNEVANSVAGEKLSILAYDGTRDEMGPDSRALSFKEVCGGETRMRTAGCLMICAIWIIY